MSRFTRKPPHPWRWPPSVWSLAAAVTALGALKPLHIDDTAYYYLARQIAAHPTDPYGFTIFWTQWPEPAHELLAPPVVPYWWALGLRLWGEHVWLWKLWLLPFSVLLAGCSYALARRYCGAPAAAVAWLIVFSPLVLPGYNLMLDVPSLALGLAALAAMLHALDRDHLGWAALAGLLVFLAFETKFNGLTYAAVVAAMGIVYRRLDLAAVALVVALILAYAWEWQIYQRYGSSHFVWHALRRDVERWPRSWLIWPLLSITGGLAPGVWWLALAGRRRAWGLAAGIALFFAAWAAVAGGWLNPWWLGLGGLAVAGAAAAAVGQLAPLRRLTRQPQRPDEVQDDTGGAEPIPPAADEGDAAERPRPPRLGRAQRDTLLLVAWLGLELGGYFVLTPFPATRRVMGLWVVSCLLVGRALARRQRQAPDPRGVWLAVAASAVLAAGCFGIDWLEARASQQGVSEAVARLDVLGAPGTRWFVGHWGWQFYAQRAGLTAVVPDESLIRKGELLVVPDGIDSQLTQTFDERLEEVLEFNIDDPLPLTTLPSYYHTTLDGRSTLAPRSGPRLTVRVLRARNDLVPATGWPIEAVLAWTSLRPGPTTRRAVPALEAGLDDPRPNIVLAAAIALSRIAPQRLPGLLDDSQPGMRRRGLRGFAALKRRAAPLLDEVLALTHDESPSTQAAAAFSLGAIGVAEPSVVERLETLADNPESEVAQAARGALALLGRAGLGAQPSDLIPP